MPSLHAAISDTGSGQTHFQAPYIPLAVSRPFDWSLNTNGWMCVFDVCTNACACGNSSIIQAQWDGNTAHVPPYSLMTALSASPTSNTPSNGNCMTIFAKHERTHYPTFNVSVKKKYICCLFVCLSLQCSPCNILSHKEQVCFNIFAWSTSKFSSVHMRG